MRISDWSSDVCSSDLAADAVSRLGVFLRRGRPLRDEMVVFARSLGRRFLDRLQPIQVALEHRKPSRIRRHAIIRRRRILPQGGSEEPSSRRRGCFQEEYHYTSLPPARTFTRLAAAGRDTRERKSVV